MIQEVTIKPGDHPGATSVVIDGVDISHHVKSVSFYANARSFPSIEVEYACMDGITFEGTAQVTHVCPMYGEASSK